MSPSGNDSTCLRGDPARPCLTLSKALQISEGGDTVLVANGNYANQQLYYAGSPYARTGTTAPVTFHALTTHGAVFGQIQLGDTSHTNSGRPPSYVTFDGLDFDQLILNYGDVASGSQGTFGTGITVENAKVLSRTENGLDVRVPKDLLIRNVEIGPQCCNADAGIIVGSTYRNGNVYLADGVTFDNVYIHDVAGDSNTGTQGCADIPAWKWPSCVTEASPNTGNHTDCFQWGKGGLDITIQNSRFYNCHENNMGVNDVCSGQEYFQGITFANNMFVNSKLYDLHLGAGVSDSCGYPAVRGPVTFAYNTFGGTPTVRTVAANSTVTYTGNIFRAHGTCRTGTEGGWTITVPIVSSYNMYSDGTCGVGDLTGTATLVSTLLGSEDGHLRTGSNGIDDAQHQPCTETTDFDHASRPRGTACDVGSDETG